MHMEEGKIKTEFCCRKPNEGAPSKSSPPGSDMSDSDAMASACCSACVELPARCHRSSLITVTFWRLSETLRNVALEIITMRSDCRQGGLLACSSMHFALIRIMVMQRYRSADSNCNRSRPDLCSAMSLKQVL